MATPAFVTDGSTEFNGANMNKAIISDGTKTQVKMWHARVRYNGAQLVVESSVDSGGLVTADLTFNGGNTQVEMTLAGWTNPPVVVVTPFGDTAYTTKITSISNVQAIARFYDIDTGAQIVTGVLDSNMDFNVIIMGE